MPGGAPLGSGPAGSTKKRKPSKRTCKYGPRDADGFCPKRPTSSRSSSSAKPARVKPPCKYGPRGADGYCPKKPKAKPHERNAQAAPTVRDYSTVDRAAQQAGEVIRSKKATKEQKRKAVQVLGEAVAGEATKKVGEHIAREAKKTIKNPKVRAQVISAAKKVLPAAAAFTGQVVVPIAIGAAAAYGISKNHDTKAKKWADDQLRATQKKMRLTPQQSTTLWHQYYEFALKQAAATNTFLGK